MRVREFAYALCSRVRGLRSRNNCSNVPVAGKATGTSHLKQLQTQASARPEGVPNLFRGALNTSNSEQPRHRKCHHRFPRLRLRLREASDAKGIDLRQDPPSVVADQGINAREDDAPL